MYSTPCIHSKRSIYLRGAGVGEGNREGVGEGVGDVRGRGVGVAGRSVLMQLHTHWPENSSSSFTSGKNPPWRSQRSSVTTQTPRTMAAPQLWRGVGNLGDGEGIGGGVKGGRTDFPNTGEELSKKQTPKRVRQQVASFLEWGKFCMFGLSRKYSIAPVLPLFGADLFPLKPNSVSAAALKKAMKLSV